MRTQNDRVKNIVISGTNFWNPGDDFVRGGIIRVLRELFSSCRLNLLFYNFNADFFPQSKFTGISNMAAKGDLERYRDFIDAVVIAGLSAGSEIKDLYRWIIDNQLQDRVYLIGAGYENQYVERYVCEEPEATIFRNAQVIIGRTGKTPKFMQELALPYHHLNCPAILSVPEVKGVTQGKEIEKIGFSIQLPHDTGVVNQTCSEEMYRLGVEILLSLSSTYAVEVVAHHKSEYFHFLNLLKGTGIPIIFSSFHEELFDVYPGYDLVITTRLHSSLFANGFGIPGIIINDTDRHTHCLEGFPHSVWVRDMEEFHRAFTALRQMDLQDISREAEEFKRELLAAYLAVLRAPFGLKGEGDPLREDLAQKIRMGLAAGENKERVLAIIGRLSPDRYLPGNISSLTAALENREGWFDSVVFLNWYAHYFRPMNYLEVGVRRGRSMAQVLLESPETKCYAFDMWIENYAGEPNTGSDFVASELSRLGASALPRFIVGDSHETLPAFWSDPSNPRLFELINIDGDHSYQGAKLDLDLAFEHLAPGGVLLFDDIRHVSHPELWSLWQEYKARYPDHLFLEDESGNGTACAFKPPFQRLTKILAGEMATVSSDWLPIHFFTIVLNGEPFIRYHIEVLKDLPFKWHWHIVEGVAELVHDTSWCMSNGGRVTEEIHRNGLSNDGTSAYLDELAGEYPDNVTIYRKSGAFWEGKLEMVNAPLPNIDEECLLWQVDADELWTAGQIITVRDLFLSHPEKTAAYYFCRYFVTPDDIITTHDTYGNYTSYEWLRTWRYTPGSRWFSHEPPRLCRPGAGETWQDIAAVDPFMHLDTDTLGLRFQHFAYATANQLRFKEVYYGYSGAVANWLLLRRTTEFPVPLKGYFSWVRDDALVDRAKRHGVTPLARQAPDGTWSFGPPDEPASQKKRRILLVRTDSIGDAILASSMLPHIGDAYRGAHISVLCQEHIAELYEASPLIDEIITFNLKRAETDFPYRDRIVESIRERRFDLALNSVYSRNGLNDHFVMAGEIVERIGLQGDLSNLTEQQREVNNANYSKLLPSEGGWKPELERHRDFLAGLGIRVSELAPCIWITPDDISFAEEFFQTNQLDPERTVALFAGAQHSARHYQGYGKALEELCIRRGLQVVALGAAEDTELNGKNLSDLSVRTMNLSGKTTLRQTAAILSRCCLAVGAETGLAHMACAVDVPNVILLGGGHAGRFIPYSPLTTAVSLPLACFGCNWQCRYVTTYCVKNIDPVTLGKACLMALDTPAERPRVFVQTSAGGGKPDDFPNYTDISRFIDPNISDIITLRGDFSMQNSVTTTAEQLHSANLSSRLQQGEELFSRGDYDSAISCFNRIVQSHPESSAPAHNNLGVIYWQQGETKMSLDHLSSALRLDPSYRPAVTNSIAVLEQLGAFTAASGICRAFLEQNPDDLELQDKMRELGDSGFHQLEENWEKFAQTDPMWAILTDPSKKGNKWEPGEFFATGIKDIQGLFRYLEGINIHPRLDSALDFGCGVGRITQALAMRFRTATGIDIAPSMIREAKRHNRFDPDCRYLLNQRNDLEQFADGTFDFIYSVITLQHIRPLYIRKYLVEFMRVLNPTGILVFQLPSRLYGVTTPRQELDYATDPACKEPRMEMHGIPKEEIIRFLEEHGGKAVDIVPDRSLEPAWESYRYCVVKCGS